MLLELLAAASLLFGGDDDSSSYDAFDSCRKRNDFDSFEEADSIFDRHGNEHIVDDDYYCDDCDDYHDDCDDY